MHKLHQLLFDLIDSPLVTQVNSFLESKTFVEELVRLSSKFRGNNTLNKMLTGNVAKVKEGSIRYYLTEHGKFPSVTTVIKCADNADIDGIMEKHKRNLAEKIGYKKAENQYRLPTVIGDWTHEMIAKYLEKNDEFYLNHSIARSIKKDIFDRIEEVIAVEYPVWHEGKMFAGTVDCVARLDDGKVYLLDWKTSKKAKSLSSIKSYQYQAAAYCMAFYKRTGIRIDGVKICVMYRGTVGKRKPRMHDIFDFDREQIGELAQSFDMMCRKFHGIDVQDHPF
jgi:hypothetical protein